MTHQGPSHCLCLLIITVTIMISPWSLSFIRFLTWWKLSHDSVTQNSVRLHLNADALHLMLKAVMRRMVQLTWWVLWGRRTPQLSDYKDTSQVDISTKLSQSSAESNKAFLQSSEVETIPIYCSLKSQRICRNDKKATDHIKLNFTCV